MKPIAYTFVDDKMMDLAEEQADNFARFGINHKIIKLSNITAYDTDLWLEMLSMTIDAIKESGKIFRVDAEVRLHKDLPQDWLDHDNVFFSPRPIIKDPHYYALNTGQLIASRSAITFCQTLKECILAMIPPDGDTRLNSSGQGVHIDDEWVSAIALRLSNVSFHQEYIKVDRRFSMECSANRGTWLEDCTVLTHPSDHTWNMVGGGSRLVHEEMNEVIFINHYTGDLKEAEFIANLMINKKDTPLWSKISNVVDDGIYEKRGFIFQPSQGLFAPIQHWPHSPKRMVTY